MSTLKAAVIGLGIGKAHANVLSKMEGVELVAVADLKQDVLSQVSSQLDVRARLPRTGEEVFVKEIQRVSGGTAANVSVAAARILGKNRVAFIGALGDDSIAEKQIKILEEEGVDTSGILHVSGEESGQAYISIDNKGLNEIHTYFGANLKIKREHLRKRERLDLISKAKVCVIMDPPIETAEEMVKICKNANITVIWGPGVYAEKDLKTLLPTLKNTDYLILNNL